MRQKKITLDNQTPENSVSKLPFSIMFYANTINRDKLTYKDGSIPFSISTRLAGNIVPEDFSEIFSKSLTDGRIVTKKFLLNTYYVYRIPDYGNQSLSPGLADFSYQVYDNEGYKLPENRVAIIRNYTSKEVFLLVKKNRLEPNSNIHIVIDFRRLASTKLPNERIRIDRENSKFSFNTLDKKIDDLDTLDFFVTENGTTFFRLNNSDYMFKIDDVNFADNGGSSFVSEQGTYFDFIQNRSGNWDKKYHNAEVIINDNLKNINTLYIQDRKNYINYHYNSYGNLKNFRFVRLSNLSIFKYNPNTDRLTKLINGYDVYLDSSNLLKFRSGIMQDNNIIEIYVRTRNNESYSFPINAGVFNITEVLYNNYFGR
jgi:hypothetical protein